MDTRLLARMTRELAQAIRAETSLPSRRRRLEQYCSPGPLEGFRQLPRPGKDSDDRTRRIDEWAERLFLSDPRLIGALPQFVAVSEERGVLYYPSGFEPGPGRRFNLLILDPVDNTELVIRRLGGAVTVLLAGVQVDAFGLIEKAELTAVAVADIAGGEVFFTEIDSRDAVVSDGEQEEKACHPRSASREYSLSAFLIKPARFQQLAPSLLELSQRDELALRFFFHHGGPLPLCRVAAGDLDAAFDLCKGYKAMDYAPGLWIAERCGCFYRVFDESGKPLEEFAAGLLRIPPGKTLDGQLLGFLEQRTRFAVARTPELLDLVLGGEYEGSSDEE